MKLLFIFCALALASEIKNESSEIEELAKSLPRLAKEYDDLPEEKLGEMICSEMKAEKIGRLECKMAPRLTLTVDRSASELALLRELLKFDNRVMIPGFQDRSACKLLKFDNRGLPKIVAGADWKIDKHSGKTWGERGFDLLWDAACICGLYVFSKTAIHAYDPTLIKVHLEAGSVERHRKLPLATGLMIFVVGNYLRLMNGHWRHHRNKEFPHRQKYIAVASAMAPVFAITNWYGLLAHSEMAHLLLDSLRECYESVTLWAFLLLMYDHLEVEMKFRWTGYTVTHVPSHVEEKDMSSLGGWITYLGVPFGCNTNKKKIQRVANYALLFIVFNVLYAVIEGTAEFGCEHAGTSWKSLKSYSCAVHSSKCVAITFTVILNIILGVELPGFIQIEGLFPHQLHEANIFWKFVMIKGIVMAMFWETSILKLLEYYKVWPCTTDTSHTSVAAVSKKLQQYLAMFWMVGFSLANNNAFAAKEFANKKMRKRGLPCTPTPYSNGAIYIFAFTIFIMDWIFPDYFPRVFNGAQASLTDLLGMIKNMF